MAIARAFILSGQAETLVAQAISVAIANYGSSTIQPVLQRASLLHAIHFMICISPAVLMIIHHASIVMQLADLLCAS